MSNIDYIDNSKEAKKIYNEYFENNKSTIFLNGKWGSGKTTFLKEVFKNRKKELKVNFLDLWRRGNDSEVVQAFYRKIYPFSYYFIKGIVIIISLVILALSFSIGHIQSFENISFSLLILGLIISLNTYIIKIDWETFFFTALKKRVRLGIRKKIVIIDDFDRISEDTQEVLYKIFNTIQSRKIQFVFVGHYINVSKSETSYLQKIIDERIELPYEIQPTNIWKQYNNLLIEEMNEKRSLNLFDNEVQGLASLCSLAIKENRVIRELNKFTKTVDTVLMNNEKYDKVNLDQQLIIIYLYEFHYSLYESLISEIELLLKARNSIIWQYSSNTIENEQIKYDKFSELINNTFSFAKKDDLSEILIWLLSTEKYPFATFVESFPNYIINYQPNNLGSNKFICLIQKEKFKEITELSQDDLEEFYFFLTKNQNTFPEESKGKLFRLSMYILENKLNIEYFFRKSGINTNYLARIASIGLYAKHPQFKSHDETLMIFLQPSEIIRNLDLTQRVRICYYYYRISLDEINDRCSKIVLDGIENFSNNYMHPSILLTTGLSLKNDQIGIEISTFEDIIDKLSENEFLYYLYYNSIYGSRDSRFKIKVKNTEIYDILTNRLKKIDQNNLSNEFILSRDDFEPVEDIY